VVVAVPFISITEQTADVYRQLFRAGDSDNADDYPVVLEHHSGVDGRAEEGHDEGAHDRWRRLASENWDAPIVVTTTVQLFESLFASSTSRCRKLHRLAQSVIILDEAQALPPHLLKPILNVLRELCTNYGATVVISTATQPAFEHISAFADLPAYNIVPDAARWFAALSRVRYEWRTDTPMSWTDVAELLQDEQQSMAILNTKRDALALLDALGDEKALHLSTLLCGAHRRVVLDEVHQRLQRGRACRLISTQVVEAGVDLDFPLVLRALGPLDRIIQAAGRCNREGKQEFGRVVVFNPTEGALPQGPYRTATDLTSAMIRSGNLNPDDPATMTAYFRRLFATVTLDREGIEALRKTWDFTQVAKKFRMIDEDTEDVIVPYGNKAAQARVQTAINDIRNKSLRARFALRHIQPYLVSIRAAAAKRYRTQGFLEPLDPEGKLTIGIWHGRYDPVRGLVVDDDRSLMIV
jgi:CRISPR-associated endonuclease/helicase Cas3